MITEKALKDLSYKYPVVLFDGDCILCSKFVQWIITHDSRKMIRFCAFQKIEHNPYTEKEDYMTVILLENGQAFNKSSVSIRVLKSLGGFWNLLLVVWIIPKWLRDKVYDIIAKNRYKWFGKKENCLIMTDDVKSRILM